METTTLKQAGCKLALNQRAPGVVVGDKDDACKLALSPIIVGGDNQDSVVALLFQAPTPFKNGEYGISMGVDGGVPLSTVEKVVEDFIGGYYNALGTNKTLHVRVVIATSNGTTQCSGNAVKREHGQAWAHMVNKVADWVISQGYSGQVDVAGGSDMESSSDKFKEPAFCDAAGKLQWASAADTKEWVMGYNLEPLRRLLYNVGDAGGCPGNGKPPQTAASVSCDNQDWFQKDVWYVSWGAPPSEPLPQIYRTDGNMSTQWANLSLYGSLAQGGSMIMAGSLTEFQDCACGNKPEAGWLELFNKLNGDPRTAQKTLSWSTDIKPMN